MKNIRGCLLALALAMAVPAFSQHQGERPEEHTSRAPAAERAPRAPEPRKDVRAPRESEHVAHGVPNNKPHVANNHWYEHDSPGDARYHLPHPFAHGHFAHIGPSYHYSVVRVDSHRHRFWMPGGFFFEVADWDWGVCADWCWTCANEFAVYDDPDHPGWYMLYDFRTHGYVHVMYMGM